jgi:hypothetical protein
MDGGGDGEPCLLCSGSDAGELWEDPTQPLGKRMVSLLDGCTGAEACHNAGSGGLLVLPGKELDDLVRVRAVERPELFRVAPGDPVESYLWLKLAGDGGIDGAPMPSGAERDPRRAALAWDWIEAGAPAP